MTCANEETKVWLKESVGALGKICKQTDLIAGKTDYFPRRPRVLEFIPSQRHDYETIRIHHGRHPYSESRKLALISKKEEK